MQLVPFKRITAMLWASAAFIICIAGTLDSFSSWAVLAGVAVVPPLVMMWGVERPSPDGVREHPGGTAMTIQAAVVPDVEADIRWREWQARGAASDRRIAARMRKVTLLIVAALIVWFVVQLT